MPDLSTKNSIPTSSSVLIVEKISTFDFRLGAQNRKEIKRIQKMFSANKNAKFFKINSSFRK